MKKENGITLIALVITIIILLILAGVAISIAVGNNGILNKATDAVTKTRDKETEEAVAMGWASTKANYLDELSRNKNIKTKDEYYEENLGTYLSSQGRLLNFVKDEEDSYILTYESTEQNNQYVFKIDGNDKITLLNKGNTVSEIQPGETATGGNKVYSDGVETAIIPKGFTVSGIAGEKSISSGLVIYDLAGNTIDEWNANAETIKETYNQYVWIPVKNYELFERYDGFCEGQIDLMIADCQEPYSSGYGEEEEEFLAMKKSVKNNKGFYVGRYEASENNGTAESKRGKTVWGTIPWGESMSSKGTSGAVYKSQQVYNNNASYGVTSTLIYGVQWDAIMTFMDPKYPTGDCDLTSYVVNSEGKGHSIESSYTTTGFSDNYKVKNIYDLAGNVWEWTMEAYKDTYRVYRGGEYRYSLATYPVSVRSGSAPYRAFYTLGFRVALYL